MELRQNNIVDFPKKHTNYKTIKPVEYELVLLKTRTESDTNRTIRDEAGKLVEEKNNSSKWVIIDKAPYEIEETFYVYGYDNKKDRFTVRDIIKKILFKGLKRKNDNKRIIVLRNKLILEGEEFDFIVCKNDADCQRLYDKLHELTKTSTIKDKLVFMGIASNQQATDLYYKIQEKTGWNMTKIWRSNTRP
jgi:ribosomal silencing factor RsfS